MPRDREIRIDDRRRHSFWIADNVVIDEYAAKIGPHAFMVYCLLLRMAGDKRECYPGHGHIMRTLKLSRPTVTKAIRILEEAGLIRVVERLEPGTRERATNQYIILDVSQATKPSGKGGKSDFPPQSDEVGNEIAHVGKEISHQVGNEIAQVGNGVSQEVGNEIAPKKTSTEEDKLKKIDTATPTAPRRRERPPDPIFDALVEVFGIDLTVITDLERGALNKAAKAIRTAGGTPEQVKRAVQRYRAEWPDIECTPMAIAKHWSRFAVPRRPARASKDPEYWTPYHLNRKGAA